MRLSVLLFDGCLTSTVTNVIDVVRLANRLAHDTVINWHLVSMDGGKIRSSANINFDTDCINSHADWLLIPGLDHSSIDELNETLIKHQREVDAIREHYYRGGSVASACSGAMLLADAGILDGKRATVSWWLAGELSRRVPLARVDAERMLVSDGRITTSGALTASCNLALKLVAEASSAWIAERCASVMLIDAERSTQNRFTTTDTEKHERTSLLSHAEAWLKLQIANADTTSAALAEACLVSQSTLKRQFKNRLGCTPEQRLRQLRMAHAKELLEHSTLSVDDVGSQCGYKNTRAFKRAFSSAVGQSPARYRKHIGLINHSTVSTAKTG